MSITQVEKAFASSKRNAAEQAYALAMLHKQEGNREEATRYGQETLRLLSGVSAESASDCAALNVTIGGIAIPDMFHEEVVRDRLQPLSL